MGYRGVKMECVPTSQAYHMLETSTTSPLPVVKLKIERRSSHPWIFQKMVEKPQTRIPPGSVVDVHDITEKWVARGFYNGHSRITIRVLTTKPEEAVDEAFFAKKLAAAVSFRRDTLKLDDVTNAYRLVHSRSRRSERSHRGPVRRYARGRVLRGRDVQAAAPRSWTRFARITPRRGFTTSRKSTSANRNRSTAARGAATAGRDYRTRAEVPRCPGSKHKTGFFVDQRDNRNTFSQFCRGKRVLDICCNTGGFGVYAKAKGGASEVVGLDLDEQALDMAKQNAKLNGAQIRYVQADLFVAPRHHPQRRAASIQWYSTRRS